MLRSSWFLKLHWSHKDSHFEKLRKDQEAVRQSQGPFSPTPPGVAFLCGGSPDCVPWPGELGSESLTQRTRRPSKTGGGAAPPRSAEGASGGPRAPRVIGREVGRKALGTFKATWPPPSPCGGRLWALELTYFSYPHCCKRKLQNVPLFIVLPFVFDLTIYINPLEV